MNAVKYTDSREWQQNDTPQGPLLQQMVQQQLKNRGITDARVLRAMLQVQRHLFVPEDLQSQAYDDRPLPIGLEQMISQPYVVGWMTQCLALEGSEKVLEIGTGSAYQTAILAQLAASVYSIEILAPLLNRAREQLSDLKCNNTHLRHGDGYFGWPEEAPYDAIILTAAPETVPPVLLDQLMSGGRLVAPVGGNSQRLVTYTRDGRDFNCHTVGNVRFVPMTGEALRDSVS